MKGMKRKFFLKRMWNFVVVMLIPALLLAAWAVLALKRKRYEKAV